MATPILITTAAANVIVKDLGIEIVHPAVAQDTAAVFGLTRDELQNSLDLQAALDGATITATFDGNAVTNLQDDVGPTNTGGSGGADKFYLTASKTGGFSSGWLRWKDNIETRNTCLVVPFDCTLDQLVVSQTLTQPYTISIYEDAATNTTQMSNADTLTYSLISTNATTNNSDQIIAEPVAGVTLSATKRYAIEVVRIGGTPNPTGVVALLECTKV